MHLMRKDTVCIHEADDNSHLLVAQSLGTAPLSWISLDTGEARTLLPLYSGCVYSHTDCL